MFLVSLIKDELYMAFLRLETRIVATKYMDIWGKIPAASILAVINTALPENINTENKTTSITLKPTFCIKAPPMIPRAT